MIQTLILLSLSKSVKSVNTDQTLMINYYNNPYCNNTILKIDKFTREDCFDHYSNYDDCCQGLLNTHRLEPNEILNTCYNINYTNYTNNTNISYLYTCAHSDSFFRSMTVIFLVFIPLSLCLISIFIYKYCKRLRQKRQRKDTTYDSLINYGTYE